MEALIGFVPALLALACIVGLCLSNEDTRND
jgi:hypothetical protein